MLQTQCVPLGNQQAGCGLFARVCMCVCECVHTCVCVHVCACV